jgi:hypothetical protein
MEYSLHRAIFATALLLIACGMAGAQAPEFLPEVDAHLTLSSHWKTYVQAKDDRDEGAPKQLGVGPSVQLCLKPFLRLKDITAFDLDDAKNRTFVLETGYRYVTQFDGPPTNRMQAVAYLNFPLKGRLQLNDRNRTDLDWKSGNFSWRYRNKLALQHTVSIGSYHLIPYAAVESYYTSQYRKWSTTALYARADASKSALGSG